MIKLQKNLIIAAPPEKVFDVVYDTANIPQVWRNVSNVRNLRDLPNGGHSFQLDYSMAGLRLTVTGTDLFVMRPYRVITRTTGGVTSTLSWTFKSIENDTQTDLLLEVTYEVPVPLIGNLAEYVVAKINEADVVHMLNGFRRKLS